MIFQCNAQLFVNIEFLGCRYSKEVMERIESMAQKVPAIRAHRESRKNSLKRCFVHAQDAVASKYQNTQPKKRKLEPISFVKEQQQPIHNDEPQFNQINDDNQADFIPLCQEPKERTVKQRQERIINKNIRYELKGQVTKILDSDEEEEKKKKFGWDDDDIMAFTPEKPLIQFTSVQKSENLRNLLKDVILFENEDDSDTNWTINKTIAMMQKTGKVKMHFDAEAKQYMYLFNDQIIGEGSGNAKKIAKKQADEDFIKTLKENCYTIRSKLKYFSLGDVIQKNQSNNGKVTRDDQKLQENNLGFKMLKSLGWKGGSLGNGSDGIIDPINLEIKIGRLGLGSTDITQFDIKYFRNLLKNFQRQNLEYDLVFSSEFTKEERAQIHQ